jgi:hypothetical protein
MKQTVLSPTALIVTMLMVPKTNEHGLKKKKKKEERKDTFCLLSASQAAGGVCLLSPP